MLRFNRSHYEDVLVGRVHDLAPKKLWQERYGHIADFKELLAEHGTIVLKYFLHITRDEQEQRLFEREKSRDTAWKLNPNDWRERDHWDEYTKAYEDAISKTAAPHVPDSIPIARSSPSGARLLRGNNVTHRSYYYLKIDAATPGSAAA